MVLMSSLARASDAPLFDAPALTDEELGQERGGFQLPGGVEVKIAVVISTSLNGVQILTSQYVAGSDAPAKAASAAVSANSTPDEESAVKVVQVTRDRDEIVADVTDVTDEIEADLATVIAERRVSARSKDASRAPSIAVQAAAPQSAAPQGKAASSDGLSVRAEVPGLIVEHTIGNSVGTLIANTLDAAVVDNQISIDIALDNVRPMELGSLPFRVDNLAIDAMAIRGFGT